MTKNDEKHKKAELYEIHDTGDAPTPSQQGRAGGNLERDVGTQDALKRATQSRPGTTRVRKEDKIRHGTREK